MRAAALVANPASVGLSGDGASAGLFDGGGRVDPTAPRWIQRAATSAPMGSAGPADGVGGPIDGLAIF